MAVVTFNLTATGSTSGVQAPTGGSTPKAVAVLLEGDDGGGASVIEVAHEDVAGSYVPLFDEAAAGAPRSYSAEGALLFSVPPGLWIRVRLAGGAAHDLNIAIVT